LMLDLTDEDLIAKWLDPDFSDVEQFARCHESDPHRKAESLEPDRRRFHDCELTSGQLNFTL
jgi:hypothetical protein